MTGSSANQRMNQSWQVTIKTQCRNRCDSVQCELVQLENTKQCVLSFLRHSGLINHRSWSTRALVFVIPQRQVPNVVRRSINFTKHKEYFQIHFLHALRHVRTCTRTQPSSTCTTARARFNDARRKVLIPHLLTIILISLLAWIFVMQCLQLCCQLSIVSHC